MFYVQFERPYFLIGNLKEKKAKVTNNHIKDAPRL